MPSHQVITVKELSQMLDTEEGVEILDVLPSEQFEQRHLPGARNASVYEVSFLADVKAAGIRPEVSVATYATNDRTLAAADAAAKLERAGYASVRILEGGIEEWVNQGQPVEGSGAAEPDAPPPAEREDLKLDTERSRIRWVGRNLAGRHEGEIRIAGGAVTLEHGRMVGGRVELDMTAITCTDITDGPLNRILIDHLESDDFFDVERYRMAVFEITDVEPVGDAVPGMPDLRVIGSLTLKGVMQPVRMMLTSGRSGDGEWFAQANFDLDRTRFGVNYGSGKLYDFLGMHLVNDLISLELLIVAS